PPGHEAAGVAAPALGLEERRHRLREALLHVDDGAVLIEGQGLDLALQDLRTFHHLVSKAGHRPGVASCRRPNTDTPDGNSGGHTWRTTCADFRWLGSYGIRSVKPDLERNPWRHPPFADVERIAIGARVLRPTGRHSKSTPNGCGLGLTMFG